MGPERIARIALLASSLVATHAGAQVRGFVAGGLGANTVQIDETAVTPSSQAHFTIGKSNFPALQLEGGGRFESGNLQFGLGLLYHPLSYKADEQSGFFAGSRSETNLKSLMGLFAEIGWKVAAPTVLYGRLSYNQGKVETKSTNPAPAPSPTFNTSFHGFGFGAGMRYSVGSNLYLFADWHHIMADEATLSDPAFGSNTFKYKPSLTTGLIGMGWSF